MSSTDLTYVPSAPPYFTEPGEARMAKLGALAVSLSLSNEMVQHLRTIEGFKVVLVADDRLVGGSAARWASTCTEIEPCVLARLTAAAR